MSDLGWYLLGAVLLLCGVLFVLDGVARLVRATRPDLGDVPAEMTVDGVPDAVDERWHQLNTADLTGRTTPAVPVPTDEAVRAAGQLPLTWRARRADIDRCYSIWHTTEASS